MITHDPLRVALEIREQLASEKRKFAFFFGAGTSMSIGVPGIAALTQQISNELDEPYKSQFNSIKEELGSNATVELVLDRIRAIRELINNSETKAYDGLVGATAAINLDISVCQLISKKVRSIDYSKIQPQYKLSQWIHSLHTSRYWPVEIFTTNYDLLFEEAMEQASVPFFDGFIGSVNPFFSPESVEADDLKSECYAYPPKSWTRIWKIHGSINWIMTINPLDKKKRISRLSSCEPNPGDELMIFPSRDKYTESRKLPFLTYQDRLRRFVSTGEALLVVSGYSFFDEHLNEILFQGLRSNPRLSIIALMFGDPVEVEGETKLKLSETLCDFGKLYKNLSVLGPDKACIGGIVAPWGEPSRKKKDTELWPFWDSENKYFTLGNFSSFADYLELFIGFRVKHGFEPSVQLLSEAESQGQSNAN